ncbi:purine permease [Vibrio sp. SS-MA-C1-2]|uniref:nucleobase:cation symporter-2 family protein n=1 Tax=Vibrio sp. SS-MA-C1-2 TaxID=2908646 RepID=UPI001F279D9C|nr:nucleobase:cation symporter-2 family protein [Vibrio sp. SS-MA-C1-2]UJF17835.1 purine permease [Vibrio sp. SS-MA-C1-2]
MKLLYTVNQRPPSGSMLLLALQHMLASIGGIVAVPLIVGSSVGLGQQDIVTLVSAALIASGIVTIVQCIGFKYIGIRLPVVMGSSFAFLGALIAIGASKGLPDIFGASLAGSFVVVIASFFMGTVRKLFPPVVSGVVVTLIGLTILPVAMNWIGDSQVTEEFATIPKLFLAAISLGIVIFIASYGKGILGASAIFIGLVGGTIVATVMGVVDISTVANAPWFALPEPMKFGMNFSLSAVITISLVYLVVVAEATGDFMALANNCKVELKGNDLKKGLLCDGLGSTFAAFMSAMPLASFSQNVGIVGITGVASRYVVATTGVLMIIAGLFPKVGALAVSVPKPVLGGVGIVMFGMIAYSGIRMLVTAADTRRNALVICIGIASGLAVTYEPRLIQHLHPDIKTIFHSGISTGTLIAILVDQLLPKSKSDIEAEEKAHLVEDLNTK